MCIIGGSEITLELIRCKTVAHMVPLPLVLLLAVLACIGADDDETKAAKTAMLVPTTMATLRTIRARQPGIASPTLAASACAAGHFFPCSFASFFLCVAAFFAPFAALSAASFAASLAASFMATAFSMSASC